jgi:hypothetical protein
MFAVLAATSLIIWLVVASQPAEIHQAITCNQPPAPTDPGQPRLGNEVPAASMVNVVPAKLADTNIRVLNASGQGGQAGEVAGELRDLGFNQPAAGNDPIFGATRMECQGQIRFGPAGKAAAAALWLVAPCTQLFQDQRPDDTVDLAIGTEFTELSQNDDIQAMLTSLKPDATQPADPALLPKIHSGTC